MQQANFLTIDTTEKYTRSFAERRYFHFFPDRRFGLECAL
jgi:hypothetical protein